LWDLAFLDLSVPYYTMKLFDIPSFWGYGWG
jgi:hypothetical protein